MGGDLNKQQGFEIGLCKLTRVRPLVDFEVLRPGKDLPTSREWAGEGLFSGVDPDVVDQLILGLERPPVPGAVLPEAGVVCNLRATHVLHGDVGDNLMHGAVDLAARLPGHGRQVGVDPHAGDLLLEWTPHVAEEGSLMRRRDRRHPHPVHVSGGVHLVAHLVRGGPVCRRHPRQSRPRHALHGV